MHTGPPSEPQSPVFVLASASTSTFNTLYTTPNPCPRLRLGHQMSNPHLFLFAASLKPSWIHQLVNTNTGARITNSLNTRRPIPPPPLQPDGWIGTSYYRMTCQCCLLLSLPLVPSTRLTAASCLVQVRRGGCRCTVNGGLHNTKLDDGAQAAVHRR